MKVVFFGTDSFAARCLDALQKEYEIVSVITVPDAPVGRKQLLLPTQVSVLGQSLGLPVFKPETLKHNIELEAQLKNFAPDLFVIAIYSKIIPDSILAIPKRGCINVHPSLLPQYRGPAPIRTPLLNGDTKTGVSIMLMDAAVDHGPILMTEELPISPDDTNVSLTEKLAGIAPTLLTHSIAGYVSGSLVPVEQDHAKATFTRIVKKENGRIDWQRPAQEIYNMWRAYQPWPGIFTTWNGRLLKIIECRPARTSSTSEPGTVAESGDIACGGGTSLQVVQLQLEGKQQTDFESFVRGNQALIGSKL